MIVKGNFVMSAAKKVFVSFDIDGTVVLFNNQVKIHHKCFQQAISEQCRPIKEPMEEMGRCVYGWMDRNIIYETLKYIGYDTSDESVQKIIDRSVELFEQNLTAVPEVPPGIKNILKELSENENVTIALASGNLEGIAWKKLKNAGIDIYFKDRIGGFGDVCKTRTEALLLARKKAEEKRGYKFDVIIHVGDMPTDVDSAHEAGAIAVAVRTGRSEGITFNEPVYDFENLEVCHDEFMRIIDENYGKKKELEPELPQNQRDL